MVIDEFSTPLGQHGSRQQRRRRLSDFRIVMGVAAVAAALVSGWAMTLNSPFRARPNDAAAVLQVARAAANASAAADEEPRVAAPEPPVPAPAPALRTVTIIDGTSGNRREIVIPDPDAGASLPPRALSAR
ncbi:MAG TPA: hypothetical protein VH678_31525 [Xanthobacteraceae bacterium]|jgi:hypothetical protein